MKGNDEDEMDNGLALPPLTLAALASFFDEQAAAQQALADLKAGSYDNVGESRIRIYHDREEFGVEEVEEVKELPLSRSKQTVDLRDFKRIFKEDWQLSQFWYTMDTAEQLVEAISKLSKPASRIAFLCCPTAYVAYKEKAIYPSQRLRLLEHDSRFAIFASADFVNYDLNNPLSFPLEFREEMRLSQDIVVVDPPFHAKSSQEKLASTIRHMLDPEEGTVVLLTGTSMTPILDDVYQGLPKFVRKGIVIKHDGLETPYGCWVGKYNHNRDSSGFGDLQPE